jgi:hypothetical protein
MLDADQSLTWTESVPLQTLNCAYILRPMRPRSLNLFVATALAVAVAACGSGSNSSSSAAGTGKDPASGEASAEFLVPHSPNNKLVRFGAEAPPTEREAASKVLKANYEARERAHFAAQCATLSKVLIEEIVGPSKKGTAAAAACAGAVKSIAEPLNATKKVRADNLRAPIAALRMKGKKGYALYHGTDKKDHAMLMEKEKGEWKVGALLATELGFQ